MDEEPSTLPDTGSPSPGREGHQAEGIAGFLEIWTRTGRMWVGNTRVRGTGDSQGHIWEAAR